VGDRLELRRRPCSWCGAELRYPSYFDDVVCSPECYRAKRAASMRTVKVEHTCAVCGRVWVPVRRDAVTCGASCRAKLSRRRAAAG
jgi:hypothetical protein